jgi:ADP-ribose pyrophosphatase YjhB (NUDIX family)
VVADLEKLSQALSNDTPEKLAERELREKADQILEALRRDGFYDDTKLGVRISSVPAA